MPVLVPVNASDDRMMHDVPAMASDKDMDNTVLFIVVILALLSLRLFSSLLLGGRAGIFFVRRKIQIQ